MTPSRLHPPEGAFDRQAYDRFQLPRKLGDAVAAWDEPEMVPAEAAHHMRPDDNVIGIVFRQRPRAYPFWVIDNYHAVNDRVDGERIVVASCERCQSGSAFRSDDVGGNPDREPLFRAAGVLNAVLLFKDVRSGSYWNHYEGVAVRGRLAGDRLPWIPAYHMEWQDWTRLHPDTEVMAPPNDPTHPDARHGHGREELFSRPGMDLAFLPTIVGDLDRTFPENEMVLGLHEDERGIAFPLREVQRERGVAEWQSSDGTVVVFSGPGEDGFTMSAFLASDGHQDLTFARREGRFVDAQTESHWTIEGLCVRGPLQGVRLRPVPWFYVRWHAWLYFHRDTELFTSDRPMPLLGEQMDDVDTTGFQPLLTSLAGGGHEVRTQGPVVSQVRPRESESSMTVYVDGDRLHLHRFRSSSAARDFVALEGAWSGFPYRARLLESRVRRFGRVVLHSDPEDRFADPAQIVPRSPSSLPWSTVLDSTSLGSLETEADLDDDDVAGFAEAIRSFRRSGWDVLDVGFLPPGQLRPGCINGIALTIQGDRFLLYRFSSQEGARAYGATEKHAVVVGPFVLRSTPITMYVDPVFEILRTPDQDVLWSPLLRDPRIPRVLGSLYRRTTGQSAQAFT